MIIFIIGNLYLYMIYLDSFFPTLLSLQPRFYIFILKF